MATLLSNVGTWMFNVTSGWVMTELTSSPLMVALVQVATTLPIFMFALPAGALGDILDRRSLLLFTQAAMAAALLIFGATLWLDMVNAEVLLFFTFLTGVGAAFSLPAWQAIVPRLVGREDLQSAIALNGVSVNIARAAGPAIGGFVLVAVGAVWTILLDALSYVAVIIAILWWKKAQIADRSSHPPEELGGALQAGLRFAFFSSALQYTIIRGLAFFCFASAYWALLPLIAKDLLGGGPGFYSLLLTSLGVGAVTGALLLEPLRRNISAEARVAYGTIGTAVSLVLFALGGGRQVGLLSAFLAGICWISVVSTLNVSAQAALPEWVRTRGLAIFQMAFSGAMTFGSLLWGKLASIFDMQYVLIAAGLLALVMIPMTQQFKLNLGNYQENLPSSHWPEPAPACPIPNEAGPVLITIEYEIDNECREEFKQQLGNLARIRKRDGAIQWGLFEDIGKPGVFIEMFIETSWVAHLRQHERVSIAYKALQDRIHTLHKGPNRPIVRHAVAPWSDISSVELPETHHD